MDIIYLENGLKWNNGDSEVVYEANNIEFASDSQEFIYVEIINDGGTEYRFVDLNGNDICKYDESNVLKIRVEDKWINKVYEEIIDVYIVNEKIYAIVSPTNIDVFEFSSKYFGTIKSPVGFDFSRFIDGEKLSVVCQGELDNADIYGRKDYRYEYDNLTNNWVKIGIAY